MNVENMWTQNRFLKTIGFFLKSVNFLTGPETLFNWIKDKLHGHLAETFVCPRCEKDWTKDEVFEKCDLSFDEEHFFDMIVCANQRTRNMILVLLNDDVNSYSEGSVAENNMFTA